MSATQLPLPWRWAKRQCFERFLAGTPQAEALAQIQQLALTADAPWVWLTGPAGSGKTHLALAACRRVVERGGAAQYLPLRSIAAAALTDWLAQLPGNALLALDDIELAAGHAALECGLFELYNRLRAEGGRLLLTSCLTPAATAIGLPDLRSRLGACTLAQLRPLGEAGQRAILLNEAALRGIEFNETVLDWLFARHPRDLELLLALLEQLDSASLAERRRVTVPFLRKLLRTSGAAKACAQT